MIEIKNIYGDVIYISQKATIKEAAIEAVSKKSILTSADLRGADLTGAYLGDAYLTGAYLGDADLTGADLRDANLGGADLGDANLGDANLGDAYLRGTYLKDADLTDADLRGANLGDAYLRGAYLRGANLGGADLTGTYLGGKKVTSLRVFSGLYCYQVWSVLFGDGSRWIRMGCLFKSLEDWEKIGIRKSNVSEFPDDGSPECEERVSAFEFAKDAVMSMEVPVA